MSTFVWAWVLALKECSQGRTSAEKGIRHPVGTLPLIPTDGASGLKGQLFGYRGCGKDIIRLGRQE